MTYTVYAHDNMGNIVVNAEGKALHHTYANLADAKSRADKAATTKYGASVRCSFSEVPVKGTTFEGRTERISVAICEKQLAVGTELRTEKYEFEGRPAVRLYAGDYEIGNLPAETAFWLNSAKSATIKVCAIYGGTPEKPNYGIRLTIEAVLHTVNIK